MYRCSRYIDECISVSCREIKTSIHVECRDFDSIDMSCRCLDEKINVDCNIVCSINTDSFLRVNPNIMWLTSDMFASSKFNIVSNVNWVIN